MQQYVRTAGGQRSKVLVSMQRTEVPEVRVQRSYSFQELACFGRTLKKMWCTRGLEVTMFHPCPCVTFMQQSNKKGGSLEVKGHTISSMTLRDVFAALEAVPCTGLVITVPCVFLSVATDCTGNVKWPRGFLVGVPLLDLLWLLTPEPLSGLSLDGAFPTGDAGLRWSHTSLSPQHAHGVCWRLESDDLGKDCG